MRLYHDTRTGALGLDIGAVRALQAPNENPHPVDWPGDRRFKAYETTPSPPVDGRVERAQEAPPVNGLQTWIKVPLNATELAQVAAFEAAQAALPKTPELIGKAGFKTASGLLADVRMTGGLASHQRVATGRYRFLWAQPQPDDRYDVVPAVRNPNAVKIIAQVTAQTTSLFEVSFSTIAGLPVDPAGGTIPVWRDK